MKIRNIKIGYRLGIGFCIILLLSGIIGFIANNSINKMWKNAENMYDHPFMVSKSVRDIRINIIAMHRSMKDVALAINDLQIIEAEVKVYFHEQKVYQSFDIVFDKFLGDKEDVQSAYDAFVNWKPIRDQVLQLRHNGKPEAAAEITKGKGADHVAALNVKIQTMIDFANKKGESLYNEAKILKDSTTRKSILILSIIVAFGFSIGAFITYTITKPLSKMLKVSNRLKKGELSARNINCTKDEAGMLAQSINDLANSIENRNTTQKGVADISEMMINPSTMQEFGSELLKQLISTTKATMSAFYILNEESMEYEHFTSIGANKEIIKSFNAQNAEGEIGNAISKKDIYYLREIPENTNFSYKTISGEISPKEIITIPILVEETVAAIISLTSIHQFSEESYEILNQSWAGINVSYSNLMSSERTRILAEQLTRTNQNLESQAEELQEQSEELQNQAVELRRSSEELQEQNIELNAQRKQVEAANKLKSEFLSNMSHELRTPLNSIMALSRVLITQTKSKLNKEETSYLEIVERNGKHLLSLINDILDLSKIESGKMEIVPKYFSLTSILQIIKDNLNQLSEEKGLTFRLNVPKKIPQIESEETKIHQILTNIVGNALKFTEEGEVEIKVSFDNKNVYFEIIDTGIGISVSELPYIFDEFRQVDGSSSRPYEGTGLGLAIANKTTRILGGNITVKSVLGEGSTFKVSLPIKWHEVNTFSEKYSFEETSSTKRIEIRKQKDIGKRILVVEDNLDAVIQLKSVLENQNYIIDTAEGGKEALDYIKHTIPDGIILDLMMPDIDGFEVLEQLRGTEETKNIPVLILTAKDLSREDLSRLSTNNIQQLIQKGDIDINGLISKVGKFLNP